MDCNPWRKYAQERSHQPWTSASWSEDSEPWDERIRMVSTQKEKTTISSERAKETPQADSCKWLWPFFIFESWIWICRNCSSHRCSEAFLFRKFQHISWNRIRSCSDNFEVGSETCHSNTNVKRGRNEKYFLICIDKSILGTSKNWWAKRNNQEDPGSIWMKLRKALIKEIKERCKDQNTKDILERIIRISMENSSIEMERQKLLPLLDAR